MDNNGDVKADFLEFMIECGALLFGDFTLKSGRKSPYFINTGEYKTGKRIRTLGDFYAGLVENSGEKFDVLYGPAYKGIPLAVVTAEKLPGDMRFAFNRKEPKDHGDKGGIIGYVPQKGDKVAIIEDVTTAGTSIKETVALFRELGVEAEITALYVSVDRMEKGDGGIRATEQIERDYGIKVYSIATASDIVGYLEEYEPVPDAKTYAAKMRDYLSTVRAV